MTDVIEQELLHQEEDTQKGRYLTFLLGNESYGIEIKHVTEIIRIQAITQVPELPHHIRGIINLRSKIIPVMDVRLRFKKPFREYNDRTCIIVIDISDVLIGLIVDSVSEVLLISDVDIVSPPEVGRGLNNRYINGIAKVENDVKLIIDCNKIINDNEFEKLSNL